jgi:hypothetical protein
MVKPIYPIPLPGGGMIGADGKRLTPEEEYRYLEELVLQREQQRVCDRNLVLVLVAVACFALILPLFF